MNRDEIKAVAAMCYLEKAWIVRPRVEQVISLCERFLARLTEKAEPAAWISPIYFPPNPTGRGIVSFEKLCETQVPLYTRPLPEPAPQEGTTRSAELPARETPVGAAPLPEDVREMMAGLRSGMCWGNAAADMLERTARNAAEWKQIAEDNMADYNEYKEKVRTRNAADIRKDQS